MSYRVTVEQLDGRPVSTHGLGAGELVLGRSSDCDIPLGSTDVSRRHARLFIHLGRCYVEDLGSANGVIVDGERIGGIVQLADTSVVVVGSFVVRVEREDGRGTPAVAAADLAQHTASAPLTFRPTIAARVPDEEPVLFALVDRDLVVGRARECGVLLVHPSVSRQHAALRYRSDEWLLEDLGSANGTEINGNRLDRPTALREGDRIRFGDVHALYTGFPDQLDAAKLHALGAARGPGVGAWLAGLVAALTLLGVGVLAWMLTSGGDAPDAASPSPELAEQLATELDSGSWSAARRTATAMLDADPDAAAAEEALARIEAEVEASSALERCNGLLDRAQQAETAGDVDNALARSLEALACLEGVPIGTQAASAAATMRTTRLTPRLIGLQRRAGALALDRQQPGVAVEHLAAAHERASTALEADVAALEPAIRRELRAARIAAASAAMQREAWSSAADHFRQAGALGALSTSERRQLAEAEAAARDAEKR